MSRDATFDSFRNLRPRGPRVPFSVALTVLAAVIDGRFDYMLEAKLDERTFRIATTGGYAIDVRYMQSDELGEWVSVEKVTLPDETEVDLPAFTHEHFTRAFLPVLQQEGVTPVKQTTGETATAAPAPPEHGLGAVAE